MDVTLICKTCEKEFVVPHWRKQTAKYCSKECAAKAARAKPNLICTQCGKAFHLKPHAISRYARHEGYFCSKKCFTAHKVGWMTGKRNHQYGLKGPLNASFKGQILPRKNHRLTDLHIYAPEHPFRDRQDRILYHRYLVEQNSDKFDASCFIEIDGKAYLVPSVCVHHKDGDHNNNSLDNLILLTRGQHSRLHNKLSIRPRDAVTGRFIKRSREELSPSDRGEGGFGSTGRR